MYPPENQKTRDTIQERMWLLFFCVGDDSSNSQWMIEVLSDFAQSEWIAISCIIYSCRYVWSVFRGSSSLRANCHKAQCRGPKSAMRCWVCLLPSTLVYYVPFYMAHLLLSGWSQTLDININYCPMFCSHSSQNSKVEDWYTRTTPRIHGTTAIMQNRKCEWKESILERYLRLPLKDNKLICKQTRDARKAPA